MRGAAQTDTTRQDQKSGSGVAAWWRVPLALLVLCFVSACTITPGINDDAPLTREEEARIGAAAHAEIVSQFGGTYDDPRITGYLSTLMGRLATSSGEQASDYRVTVLDSQVVNAFASPGGYIYVTRGLLALANDEAELASVMAHELGHLTANHSTKRQIEAARVSLLSGVLASLSGSPYLSQALGLGAATHVAGYSREQEFEADTLGIATAADVGYEPFAAASFLTSLQSHFQLQGELTGEPSDSVDAGLFSTHPSTPQRIERARDAAYRSGDAAAGYMRNRDFYFDTIEGLPYGDNPRHGVIDNRTFSHPVLRLQFEVPEEFSLINRNDVVLAQGPDDAVIIFDGSELVAGVSLREHLVEHWGEGLDLRNVRTFQVNGMNAVGAETLHRGVGHELVVIQHGDKVVYRFLFITRPVVSAVYEKPFRETIESFRRLSEREAAAIQPMRVRIVEVGARDTVASLARRMSVSDNHERRFRILNGLLETDELQPGQRVKLVAE